MSNTRKPTTLEELKEQYKNNPKEVVSNIQGKVTTPCEEFRERLLKAKKEMELYVKEG